MSSNDTVKDTARPRFYMQAIENKAQSAVEGRPIFDEREMVEVIVPGDKLTRYVGFVTDAERDRWPEIYAAFKRGEARAAMGTPLEHWPIVTTGRVAELKALNILSVEELANVPDSSLPRLGFNARELREQARTYIATAKGGADQAKMAADNARLSDTVAKLQEQMARLLNNVPQPTTSANDEVDEQRNIETLSDGELKAYIKRETGEPVRGNPSRDKLLARANELATDRAA